MPMCQGLHWTVLVVKPHTHELIYLDPKHPNTKLSDVEKETAWLFGSWVASQLPTMDAGKITVLDTFDTPLPRQTDGVSCGVFVVLYMMMFSRSAFRSILADSIYSYRWRLLKCFIDQSFECFLGEIWNK